MPDKRITIKQGPQFNGAISKVFFFVSLTTFLVGALALINHGDWLTALVAAGILILSAPICLDYRGVIIDLENQRIKQYRSYLGLKWGPVFDLDSFDQLILTWERLAYTTGGIAGVPMSYNDITGQRTRSSDNYYVYLVNSERMSRLEIGDFSSQRQAKKFMLKYAHILHLPWEDKYEKRKEAAYKRRMEREARTGRR